MATPTVPSRYAGAIPAGGSHLERYARRLSAAEINSSFHRPHRPSTYQRWADSVPPGFAFSAKVPKAITHVARLAQPEAALDAFLAEARTLGERLQCLLVQLPPSLAFDEGVADNFFAELAAHHAGLTALEPRHASSKYTK